MGPSGSQVHLMNTIGMLDTPTSGEYYLKGKAGLERNASCQSGNQQIGFLYFSSSFSVQAQCLQKCRTTLWFTLEFRHQNVGNGWGVRKRLSWRAQSSFAVWVTCGWSKSNVAIARALVNNPSIIPADELTGALDTKTGNQIMQPSWWS